jgi:hypothetical protein
MLQDIADESRRYPIPLLSLSLSLSLSLACLTFQEVHLQTSAWLRAAARGAGRMSILKRYLAL